MGPRNLGSLREAWGVLEGAWVPLAWGPLQDSLTPERESTDWFGLFEEVLIRDQGSFSLFILL